MKDENVEEAAAAIPFRLAEGLIALEESAARRLPLRALGRSRNGWTIGIRTFADDACVHADHWECHPAGDEVLFLLEGRLHVTLSGGDAARRVELAGGQALIVPRGRWHRLQVREAGRLMFVTPSTGSRHRRVAGDEGAPPA